MTDQPGANSFSSEMKCVDVSLDYHQAGEDLRGLKETSRDGYT
jgi:hypothetical protein